jgi:hypothetical protein
MVEEVCAVDAKASQEPQEREIEIEIKADIPSGPTHGREKST